jgi:hypothetical protein
MDAPHSVQQPAVPGPPAVDTSAHDTVVTDAAPAQSQPAGRGDEAGPGPSSAVLSPAAKTDQELPAALEEEEEEDPLIVAQREQEEREKALEEALNIQAYDDVDMRVRFISCFFFLSPFVRHKISIYNSLQLSSFSFPQLVFSHQ